MKVRSIVLLFVVCIAAPLFAADTPAIAATNAMTDAERAALVAHLERTGSKFEKSIEGLSEAQWNYKAGPDRWSIGEASEHIITSESFIRGLIEPLMKEPAPAEMLAGARKEEILDKFLVDRSKKFQAPEPLVPTKKYKTAADALAAFRAERQKTLDFAKNGGDFRLHAGAHPAVGPLDAYGWVTFLSGHSERHTLQIEEVKADPGYPK